MITRALKIIMAVLAIGVGLYPFIYFFIDRKFGLLQSKSDAILSNLFWNAGFYSHIVLGGIALLIGWVQFNEKLRRKRLQLHRTIGKIYVFSALVSSAAAVYIALFATGGIVATLGFMFLGLTWFYSTYKAYTSVRKGNLPTHRVMMIYSYAACLAAVTLRLYLPLLIIAFHDFIKAYVLVAWLCWVPNIGIAFYLVKKSKMQQPQLIHLKNVIEP
jgi:uncharacterized membrane protein